MAERERGKDGAGRVAARRWGGRLLLALVAFGLLGMAGQTAAQTPSAGGQPENPRATTKEGPRHCLRVLWTKDPALRDRLAARLAAGEDFAKLARESAAARPEAASDQTSCVEEEALDPALKELARDKKLGEVGGPVPLAEGWALVRVTSDDHFERAKSFMQMNEPAQAEEEAKLDLTLNPDHVAAWHLLGVSRLVRQDYEGALKAFGEGLAFDPASPSLLNDRASALWQAGRKKEAVAGYRGALAAAPGAPLLLNNLAWALAMEGKELDEALALAGEAVRQNPEQANYWDTLGRVHQARGRHRQAVACFHQALLLGGRSQRTVGHLLDSLEKITPEEMARLAGETPLPAAVAGGPASKPAKPGGQGSAPAAAPAAAPADQEFTRWLASKRASETPPAAKSGAPSGVPTGGESASAASGTVATASAENSGRPGGVATGGEGRDGSQGETAAAPAPEPSVDRSGVQSGVPTGGGQDTTPQEATEAPAAAGSGSRAFGEAERAMDAPVSPAPKRPKTPPEPRMEPDSEEAKAATRELLTKLEGRPLTRPAPTAANASPVSPAAAPAPTASRPAPREVAGTGYFLQVASFQSLEVVKRLKEEWTRRGYRSHLEHLDMGNKGKWYRVLLGPYRERREVVELARRLREQGVLSDYLVVQK